MESYILGNGVFAIGATAIALTRGGGQLTVERTYKPIVADGDKGPVKDRIRKDGAVPKLTMNALSIISANMDKFYPAIDIDTTTTVGTSLVTGAADIATADYQTVTWTGALSDGKSVVITLENAINLENIDWALQDKDEVIAKLTYTGTYLETARDTEPWSIKFVDVA